MYYPMSMPMQQQWSLLEMVGALTLAVAAYYMYMRYKRGDPILPTLLSAVQADASAKLPALSYVRAPAAAPDAKAAANIPVHLRRSLPPSTPLAIQQQPSSFGNMFEQISADVMSTLFSSPVMAGGRS